MRILIKQAKIIDNQSDYHLKIVDILVENGLINKIENSISDDKAQLISFDNLHVSRGWLDSMVVFGEPGYETTETIENGLKVASKSGFTDVILHSNTNPSIDNQTVIHLLNNKAQKSTSNLHIAGAITINNQGNELAELFDMKNAGAIAFSDYKNTINNSNLFKIALQYVKDFNGLIFSQPVNKDLKGKGYVHEGVFSTKLGMKGIPAIAEEIELERTIALLEYTQSKLHVAAISTKKSVEIIKTAKAKGLNITCGVSVNNLVLNDEVLINFNSNAKIFPPIRSEEDRLALIEGVKNDIIDVITSDHCPVDIEQKKLEFDLADYGSIGLESAFGALNNVLDLEVVVKKLTQSSLFNIDNQEIKIGNKAVLTLFNPNDEYVFSEKNISSKCGNAIMLDRKMKGKVFGIINGIKSNL